MQQRQEDEAPRGKRALHKGQIRQRLLEAAYNLFMKNGFERTTIDEIAREAGVSRRSVFRYFATKEEIALGWQDDLEAQLAREIRNRPAVESVSEAILHTLETWMRALPLDHAIFLSELLAKTPRLGGYNLEKYRNLEKAFGDAALERAKTPGREFEARLTATLIVSAWRVGNDEWLANNRAGHPWDYVSRSFAALRRGLVD